MPVDYAIHAERQLVHSRAWGDVTDAELLDHQRRLALDPAFDSEFSQMLDFLGVTGVKAITADGIRDVAQRQLYGPRSRRAIVAAHPVIFGLARMFASYRDVARAEEQIRVFKRLEEAWTWLGISPV